MDEHVVQSDRQAMYFEYRVHPDRWCWSESLRTLHGLPDGQEPTTDLLVKRMVPEDRAAMLARFQDHLQRPGPYSCVYRMRDAAGSVRRVMFVGRSLATSGVVDRLHGFVVDITAPVREGAREAVEASLEHRATIEQAKGALMLSFAIESDAAFDLLRVYSSQNNIKLATVAQRIVSGLSDPAFSREDPVRSLLDIVTSLSENTQGRHGALLHSISGND